MPDGNENVNRTHVEGYGATFGAYPRAGGPQDGGWYEQFDRGALEKAVRDKPQMPLKMGSGPDAPVIGTAKLSVDDVGLKIEADLGLGSPFRVPDQECSIAEGKSSGEIVSRQITECNITDTYLTEGNQDGKATD